MDVHYPSHGSCFGCNYLCKLYSLLFSIPAQIYLVLSEANEWYISVKRVYCFNPHSGWVLVLGKFGEPSPDPLTDD